MEERVCGGGEKGSRGGGNAIDERGGGRQRGGRGAGWVEWRGLGGEEGLVSEGLGWFSQKTGRMEEEGGGGGGGEERERKRERVGP